MTKTRDKQPAPPGRPAPAAPSPRSAHTSPSEHTAPASLHSPAVRPVARARSPKSGPALATDLELDPVRAGRFAEQVYESLFHAIMSGKLAPGARLPSELELARMFGVSRPVVREALARLREERLLESVRGSGSFVRADPGPMPAVPLARSSAAMRHFLDGLELRRVIEPECAYLAAQRRSAKDLVRIGKMLEGFERAQARGEPAHHFDHGFHAAIARATGNARLVQILENLEYDLSHAVSLWRHLMGTNPAHRAQPALDEHRAIVRFIEARDAESARRAMREHLENAQLRLLEVSARPGQGSGPRNLQIERDLRRKFRS